MGGKVFAPLGKKVFFSFHFCGGFGWSRSGNEVFRTSCYWRPAGWEQTSQGTPLLPAPLSFPRWNAQPKVMNPSLRSLCWLLLSFFDSLPFAQCHSLGGKDQQNKIKSPLHLTDQGKTRAPSKVEKHDFISYHCFDLILEKSVLCIEAWFLPESDEQRSNTSITESL